MHALLSTVRYVPHPARGESVNIGAFLACPEIGYVRSSIEPERRLTRIRCLDPAFDPDTVRAVAYWIDAYTEMFEEAFSERGPESAATALHELVRITSGTRVQLGQFDDVFFEHAVTPVELDQVFDDVMEREVNWHRSVDPAESASGRADFKTRVHEILQTANLYIPGSQSSPVKLNVEVNGLRFDLSFFNGRQNVVEVADVGDVNSANQMAEKAGAAVLKFEALRAEAVKSGREDDLPARIALLSGKRKLGKGLSSVVEQISAAADDVYFMGEDQDRRRFVRYVREATSHGH